MSIDSRLPTAPAGRSSGDDSDVARDTPLPLDEPAELTGQWWLPHAPDVYAYGQLTYAPDAGLELQTVAGGDVFPDGVAIPWIHGETGEGRRVTLRSCFVRRWSMHAPGGVLTQTYAQQAFVGMHAASDRQLSMLGLHARMVNLAEWLGVSGLDVRTMFGGISGIRLAQPGQLGLGRFGGALMTVSFELAGTVEPPRNPLRLDVEQHAWLQIAPRRPRRFDDLNAQLERFLALLSFASAVDCALLEVQGLARVPITEFGTGRTRPETGPVWVLFERTMTATTRQASERMLFRYEDVRARKLMPLVRWFRRWPTFGPVANVYLSGLPTRTLHNEYRFLAFAQALEGYHRRKHPARMDFKDRLDAMVAALPAPIRRHVPARFTTLAKDTRHYLSHWEPRLEARAARGEELVYLTSGVKLLFEVTLLIDLGFTKTQIAKAVLEENQRLVAAMQYSFHAL
jgi:hypothetical protein